MNRVGIFFALLLVVGLAGCAAGQLSPRLENGILDLRSWDFEQNGPASLVGEVPFYWEQLLLPAELAEAPLPTGLISIPSPWNGYRAQNQSLSGAGYATYHITLLLAATDRPLALYVPEFETAYRLYIAGALAAGNGIVGRTPETSQPQWFPQVVVFTPTDERVEIVLQISNFHHRKGGAGQKIILGTEPQIRALRERNLTFAMYLTGNLLIMAFYHLSLYTLRRKAPSSLYFGLSCLLMGVRTLTTGEYYLLTLFPPLDWKWLVGLNYLSFALTIPAFAMFTHTLFPEEIPRWQIRLLEGAAALFAWLIVLTPPRIFTHGLIPYQLLTCIGFGCFLYSLILAVRRQREGAAAFLAAFSVLFLTTLNDILYNNQLLNTGFIGPWGILVFIFIQALLLARRYSRAFTEVELLTQELETRVAVRTAELAQRNRQLLDANVELQHEIEERQRVGAALVQARDEAEKHAQAAEVANRAKSAFFANMSHELRTPLNAILGFSALMQTAPNLTPEQRENLASVRRNGERLLAMVNRVLELAWMDDDQISLAEDALKFETEPEEYSTPPLPGMVTKPTWSLADLPASWRAEMRQATLEGDLAWMTDLAWQVQATHPALATRLLEWVQHFRHDEIRQLLEKSP